MLKHLFLGAFIALNLSFAAQIFDVDESGAYVRDPAAKVGAHAVIIHKFANNESISARAEVTEVKNGLARLEFYTFADIAQASMPVPIIAPAQGDEVVFNYLYDNALLLAANEETYKQISEYLEINFISPELLANAIYKQGKLMPTRNDLREFCAAWAAGRVLVAFENSVNSYDCASLKLIKKLSIASQSAKSGINFYSTMAKPAGNFFEYFRTLLY